MIPNKSITEYQIELEKTFEVLKKVEAVLENKTHKNFKKLSEHQKLLKNRLIFLTYITWSYDFIY